MLMLVSFMIDVRGRQETTVRLDGLLLMLSAWPSLVPYGVGIIILSNTT